MDEADPSLGLLSSPHPLVAWVLGATGLIAHYLQIHGSWEQVLTSSGQTRSYGGRKAPHPPEVWRGAWPSALIC